MSGVATMTKRRRRGRWDGPHAPPDVERDTAELLGELRAMGSRLTTVVDDLEALCLPPDVEQDRGREDGADDAGPQEERPSGGGPEAGG